MTIGLNLLSAQVSITLIHILKVYTLNALINMGTVSIKNTLCTTSLPGGWLLCNNINPPQMKDNYFI